MPYPTFFNLPEEKRQALLDCAIDEFATHDYNSASISKIVVRAKIAKGSLYQYFADKQDLYQYLLELATQYKAAMLVNCPPPEPGISIFDTLRYLFRVMITFEVEYPKLAKIGYRAISGDAPMPDELMTKAKYSTRQYFITLIEDGKKKGEIRPDVDSKMAAFTFANALSGMSEYLSSEHMLEPSAPDSGQDQLARTAEIENAFNQIISIFQNGIVHHSSRQG